MLTIMQITPTKVIVNGFIPCDFELYRMYVLRLVRAANRNISV